MNYRCPKSDCAGSAAPLPEAMAQAMGMKCPVCQSELQTDEQVVEPAGKTIEGGPWVDWPTPVSLPLCEYFEEEHPGGKLWAACDAFEMLTRLIVIVLVGERSSSGGLEDGLRDRLSRLIESPTFGAWYVMARDLAEAKGGSEDLSAAREFVLGPLRDLLYGPDNPGTDETSFLKLRNRLAHGGGMTRKEQSRLLDLWQERVGRTIDQLEWMSGWELLGKSENGEWKKLAGKQQETIPAPDGVEDGESDSVWLRVNDSMYPLWPLAAFGRASIQGEGKEKTSKDEAPQVYSRKESVRLGYVPLGAEGMGYAESSAGALAAFEQMFRPSEKAQASGFKIKDFMGEIRKDAGQMVGRQKELDDIISKVRETKQGVLWISGQAGMGKSFLMAKLSVDLLDEFSESGPLVLSYRMRAGDQDRCSRDALADFITERLEGAGLMHEDIKINLQDKAEKRLETCLGGLKKDAQIVLIVDGLDEVSRRDGKFTEEVPLALRYPGVLWICSGRPEPMITEPMRKLGGEDLFPHGLPPMREEDVRGMILEKIGPLRKKLLGKDAEQDGKVINPFIRLVTERAAGLPLYVKYVIGDVLGGKYRVLDGEEELPDSLHSYHEELLRRLGVGDLQAVVTPLAAILATAYEPLSVRELVAILVRRKLLTEEGARQMVEKGLAAIASMVRSAPDPEGEVGYCLFHQSLRDHMTGSDQMTHSIAIAREAFADIAEKTDPPPELRNYLLRCGIDHLLEVNRKQEAERLLLDLDHLYAINQQGVKEITIYRYWEMLGGEIQAMRYIGIIEKLFLKSSDEDMMEKADLVSNIARKSLWLRLSIPVEEKIILKHKEIHGHVNLEITDAYENLAESYQLKGNFDRSIEFLEKSIDIRININGSRHKNIATSYNNLGLCYANKSSNNIAIEYYKKALKIFLQSGKRNSNVATIYNNLGLSYGSMGLNVEAIEYFKKSIAIDTDIHGPEFPKIAFNNLGSTFREMGDFPKAICYIEKSLKSHIHLYGKNHLSLVHPYYNLAKCFEEKREFKQALELHQKCLAIEIKNLGSEHIDLASTYHNIGETHIEEGEYQQALDSYQKCLAIEIKNLGSEHIDLASTFHNIGEIYIEKGEYQQAIDSYQKCLAIEIKNLGSEHIDLASTHEKISNTYSFINDFERSMEHSEKTLKIRLEKLGHNHPDVATALNDLGLNWTKAKNFEEAVKYLSKAVEICMNEVGSFSFENALILGNYGHALGMCGEIEKGVSFTHRALKCKLEQETLSYSSIQKSYQKLTEIFEHAGNEDRAQENEAMAKWSELRSEGRFLDEIDSVEFEKEVGISHEWARQIEEDIINSK